MDNDPLKPQSTLTDYIIKRVLGRGSFGVTYLAENINKHYSVAIKEYFPVEIAVRADDGATVNVSDSSRGESQDFQSGLDKFLEESRILGGFHSPHIVSVMDTFEFNGTAYMVMKYEEGGTLDRFLHSHREPLSEEQLLAIFIPLLQGLRTIHAKWLLHRDIKPENIYIRKDESPMLIDFGTARHAQSIKHGGMTEFLTPGFAPPEQYDRHADHGPWTDIYAVGATMYYCVTRIKPYEGRFRTGDNDPITSATLAAPAMYNTELLKIIDWMMTPDLKQRPQSVDEVLERFEGYQSGIGDTTVPDQPPSSATTHSVPANQNQTDYTASTKPRETDRSANETQLTETLELSSGEVESRNQLPDDKPAVDKSSQPTIAATPAQPPVTSNRKSKAVVTAGVVVIAIAAATVWYMGDKSKDSPIKFEQTQNQIGQTEEVDRVAAEAAKLVAAEEAKLVAEQKALEEANRVAAEETKQADQQKALIDECEAHFQANRLTSGRGGNALDCYEQLLVISPGNLQALRGIQQISDTYVRWVNRDIERGDTEKAEVSIEKLKKINAEDERIFLLEDQLLSLEKQQQQAKLQAAEQKLQEELNRIAAEKAKRAAEKEAQEEAKRVAAEKAKRAAEKKAQEEAERVAAEKANRAAEKKAQEEAERVAAEKAKRAAEKKAREDTERYYRLGDDYYFGRGVTKNLELSVTWYRKAADNGHKIAQLTLGNAYYNGEGIKKDLKESVKWYRKSASQGYAGAQYNLGNAYHYGNGVAKIFEESVKWYRKAADQGHKEAQNRLGNAYSNGEGVAKNLKESVKWYKKGAIQGSKYAEYRLGQAYYYGWQG